MAQKCRASYLLTLKHHRAIKSIRLEDDRRLCKPIHTCNTINQRVYCELHHNRPKIFHFSYCLQRQFCKLPLFRAIFNRRLGAIISQNSQ